jgi:hypothetical protein
MAKSLDEMSAEELSEALEELDSNIDADQLTLITVRRRLNLHRKIREDILDILAIGAMRKGWKH